MTSPVLPEHLQHEPAWRAAWRAFDVVGFHRVAAHVDMVTESIDWDAILATGWSTTERMMVLTANPLWTGRGVGVDLGHVADVMGDQTWDAWLSILQAFRSE